MPQKTLFLPGAGGSPLFWKPVADRLPNEWEKVCLAWPGLGNQPHDPTITGINDLIALVESHIDEPVDLVAQSMGGVIAARIALTRPEIVNRLVLVATSAGVNMEQFGASDWRPDYIQSFPRSSSWITQPEITAELAVEKITAPTLLIWGDADSISPAAVGRHLQQRIPNAELRVLPGGDHDLAVTQADLVASLIHSYLLPHLPNNI